MRYLVIIRGVAEQTVEVEAKSKSEAREKAREMDVIDLGEFDFVQGEPIWTTRDPVEECSQ